MLLALFAPLLATSVAAAPPGQPLAARGSVASGSESTPCYASTKQWRAWVEPKRGSAEPALVVSGIVTTPTGNNRRMLTLGPTLRSEPPQQIVNLEIRGQGNIATMMVVTEEVRARFPALGRYGAVIIMCNGQEVGRVSPVETAQSSEPAPPLPPPPRPSHWDRHPIRPPVPIPPGPHRRDPPPPDALGDVWEEEEENEWRGTWVRRGKSRLFDAYWVHPSGERVLAVLEIKTSGREVEVIRRHSDGQGCNYRGTIAANWVDVHGWYNCSWHRHSSPWRAQIVRMRDVAPALLSNGGWRRIQ